jgi:hypothetical protein
MPCQLMVGFFAYAKSLEINVDKEELEGILAINVSLNLRITHSPSNASPFSLIYMHDIKR